MIKSYLEKQLSDKYHPKSSKQIEDKYLEVNCVQQKKLQSNTLVFKAVRRFLALVCFWIMI